MVGAALGLRHNVVNGEVAEREVVPGTPRSALLFPKERVPVRVLYEAVYPRSVRMGTSSR